MDRSWHDSAGAREYRYAHLFSGHIESVAQEADPTAPPADHAMPDNLAQRVSHLEQQLTELTQRLDTLQSQLTARE
jgi:uncharacterized protein YceH (UPF0502 family)